MILDNLIFQTIMFGEKVCSRFDWWYPSSASNSGGRWLFEFGQWITVVWDLARICDIVGFNLSGVPSLVGFVLSLKQCLLFNMTILIIWCYPSNKIASVLLSSNDEDV